MDVQNFINQTHQLGIFLSSSSDDLEDIIYRTSIHNSWFSIDNIRLALKNCSETFLNKEKLQTWLDFYAIDFKSKTPKIIGLVAAGNLPLVAFHDILCVLASGNRLQLKLSEKDKIMLPFILNKWIELLPELSERIEIVEKLNGFDAVIATGSNNTARYFEYYFGKYKNIIRKNRNSVAILDGTETPEDLIQLGHDVFDYFGLGCRNVSKIYVPSNYDFSNLIQAFKSFSYVDQHTPYMNNMDYQRTIYLMNQTPMKDIDFINIVENAGYSSPISCLHYEVYSDLNKVINQLENDKDQLQCIVSKDKRHLNFGKTQQPSLFDYADGIDTMAFLKDL